MNRSIPEKGPRRRRDLLPFILIGLWIAAAAFIVSPRGQRWIRGVVVGGETIDAEALREEARRLPARLPVLPFRSGAPFPGEILGIDVGRPASVAALEAAFAEPGGYLIIVAQHRRETDDPGDADLYTIGCAVKVLSVKRVGPGHLSGVVRGIARVEIDRYAQAEPYRVAELTALPDPPSTAALQAEAEELGRRAAPLIAKAAPYESSQITPRLLANVRDAPMYLDFLAALLGGDADGRQPVLEALDPAERCALLRSRLPADE